MSRGSELLAQVLAAPDADPPRLVYADYLMEQGDPRGEYIAVQVQLQQRITPARRRHAKAREQELSRHQFGSDAAKLVSSQRFAMRRGFIDEIWAQASSFAKGAAELLAVEPVRYANLNNATGAHIKKLLDGQIIGRLAGLRLGGEPDLAALAASEQLRSLRRLNLSWCQIGDEGLETLVGGGNLRVESLTLNDCQIGDAGVVALAESEAMTHIKRLFLSRNEIGDEGAAALARSPNLRDMVVISIGGNEDLGDEGGRAFADTELAGKLHRLEITQAEFSENTASALRDVWGERLTL